MYSSKFSLRSNTNGADYISCSIVCYKEHKTVHANVQSPFGPSDNAYLLPFKPLTVTLVNPPIEETTTEHTSPRDHFRILESSQDLPRLFCLYPKLRAQLHGIYVATLEPPHGYRDTELESNSLFDRGRGRGRPGSQSRGRGRCRSNGAPWAPQKGRKLALSRMRKLKDCEDRDGSGIRELSRLVIRLSESKPWESHDLKT